MLKMRFGAHLKLHVDACWGASWRQDGAKLANLAPRCAQDGQLESQDGQLGAILGASWRPFLDLGRDLTKNCENQKNDDSSSLLKFFGVLGLLLEAMLVHLGSMLAYVGPSGRPLRATWRQDGAQERQDEARKRKWAPEGGRDPCPGPQRISMPPLKRHHQMKPGAPLEAQPGSS